MVPVKNEKHLFRDDKGIIHNMDDDAYQTYIRSKNLVIQRDNEIKDLKERLDRMELLINKMIG